MSAWASHDPEAQLAPGDSANMTAYRFLQFELNVDLLELRQAGDPVAIEPQVFDLLRYLIKNRERLVTRDELFEYVWQGRIVSDATLSSRVKAARQAVGDTGKEQQVIQTLPRRGFRFVAQLQSEQDTASELSAPDGLSLPNKPSIAILPFSNLSSNPEQDYFVDGMTEDIITALARLRWLFVIARNTSFTYKDRAVDITQVGRDLGVRYVLEGSVRKAGSRIRVTAQLIEADTGNHIWADRYDRELTDIFDLQDELTEAISAQVNAELASSERDHAHRKTATNLDAWELYQRGMWHIYKLSKVNVIEARRLFCLALERSPEFSNAYAGLAYIAFVEAFFDYTPDQTATLKQGLRDAERAVAFDDRDSFSHYALGRVCMILGDSDRAISALEKSIELNPSSASSLYGLGYALSWFDRSEEAIPLFDHAIRLSPHDPQLWSYYHMRALAYTNLDKLDVALRDAKAAIQAKGDEFWPHLGLAFIDVEMGRHDEALTSYNHACWLKLELSATYIKSLLGASHLPDLEKFLDALRQVGLPEE